MRFRHFKSKIDRGNRKGNTKNEKANRRQCKYFGQDFLYLLFSAQFICYCPIINSKFCLALSVIIDARIIPSNKRGASPNPQWVNFFFQN